MSQQPPPPEVTQYPSTLYAETIYLRRGIAGQAIRAYQARLYKHYVVPVIVREMERQRLLRRRLEELRRQQETTPWMQVLYARYSAFETPEWTQKQYMRYALYEQAWRQEQAPVWARVRVLAGEQPRFAYQPSGTVTRTDVLAPSPATAYWESYIERRAGEWEALVFTPSRKAGETAESLIRQGLRYARQGQPIGLFYTTAGVGMKFVQGVLEAPASIMAPWTIVRGYYTLATRPRDVFEFYVTHPEEWARLMGGFAGGYMFGRAIGGLAGRLGAREPVVFEIQPVKFKTMFMARRVHAWGSGYVKAVAAAFKEYGIARRVLDLGKPGGLVGEKMAQIVARGKWVFGKIEGWGKAGAKMLFEKVVRHRKKELPYGGKGEYVRQLALEQYGLGGKEPYLYSMEITLFSGKPVHKAFTLLKDITVKVKKPGLLGRLLGRKPKVTYTAKGLTLTTDILEKGGVARPESLISEATPSPRIVPVVPTVTYGLGGESALAGLGGVLGQTRITRATRLTKAFEEKPFTSRLSRAFMPEKKVSLKGLERLIQAPQPRTISIHVPRQATAAMQKTVEMPRLLIPKPETPPLWREVKPRKRKRRGKKIRYYGEIVYRIPDPLRLLIGR